MRKIAVLVFVLALAGSLAAAENPFVGIWKENVAKSKLTGDTIQFEKTASGAIRLSGSGMSFTFQMDGKDYPRPLGGTEAWKQIDDHTWQITDKGPVQETSTLKLSPDGQTLTSVIQGKRSSGEASQSTHVRQRVTGDKGLLGAWKSVQAKSSLPDTLEIKPAGADGLLITYVGQNLTCEAKFDGKYYPVKGRTGLTIALKRTGPRSFEWLTRENDKPLFRETVTVSQDGHTLTDAGSPVSTNEPFSEVFDRQ
jgi:hypothetical protein